MSQTALSVIFTRSVWMKDKFYLCHHKLIFYIIDCALQGARFIYYITKYSNCRILIHISLT